MKFLLAIAVLGVLAAFASAGPMDLGVSRRMMRPRDRGDRRASTVAGLAQELLAGTLPELRAIYGELHLRVGWPLNIPERMQLPPTFGRIAANGAARAELKNQSASAACLQLVYDCDGKSLELYISRLSPAVLAKTDATRLDVLVGVKGAELPGFAAISAGGKVHAGKRAGGLIPAGTKWLLLWHGRQTRALGGDDMPLLIVPWGKLLRVSEPDGGGLSLIFDGDGGGAALLPLAGIARPSARDTARWADALPEAVRQACDAWAERLQAFPVDVVEAFAYDAATDTATTTCTYRYVKADAGAKLFAPLPPMLALAKAQSFGAGDSPLKLAVSPKAEPTGLDTIFGPYELAAGEKLSWSVSGLARYVDYERPAGEATDASAPFEARLTQEVRKVIDAGMPAPWFFQYGCFRDRLMERELYWANPAEHAYFMTELSDLVPAELQERLAEHLLACPQPDAVAFLDPKAGARREWYFVKDSFLDWRMWYEQQAPPPAVPPLFNLYAVDRLVAKAGREMTPADWNRCLAIAVAHMRTRDWATLFTFEGEGESIAAVSAANRDFAGAIGLVRLARRMNDAEAENAGRARLASCAALRFAMGRYRQWLYAIGRIKMPADPAWQADRGGDAWYGQLLSFNCTDPEQDIQQVQYLNTTEVRTGSYYPLGNWRWAMRPHQTPFYGMTSEVAAFLTDHLKAQVRRYVDVVAAYQPDWYLAWAEATIGTEHNANQPVDAYQNFLARAWILGEPGRQLRVYIDVPQLRMGDYFYMHKLAETARAYRRK